MKPKYFIIFIALLIAFTSVAVAADVDSGDTAGDISASVAANDVAQSVDAPVSVSDNSNEYKIIKNTQQATENVAVKENSGQTRNTTPTVWNLTNANFSEIVTSNGLYSSVNDGDILNFTENVSRTLQNYTIDKPVNIVGNGFTLDLNTIYGYNLPSLEQTNIEFTSGASNSNITNLKFHNTQVFTTSASNITFDNINVTVDQGVGMYTGYFALRDGVINVTVKNSYFHGVNNTGCSAIAVTMGENCTIDNNVVIGEGTVGNLIYLNTYNAGPVTNNITQNKGNRITNNNITGPVGASICYGIAITGPNNLIENNTIYYNGSYGITTNWIGSYENVTDPGDEHNVSYYGNRYINNTIVGTAKFSTGNYSVIENNTFGGTSTIVGHANVTNNIFLAGVTVHNNVRFHSNDATGQTVNIQRANSCFKNNIIGTLYLKGAYTTYDCGNNTLSVYNNKYKSYYVPCNGTCPNCGSSKNSILLKNTIKNVKTDGDPIIGQNYTFKLYSGQYVGAEYNGTLYNNGTLIINITSLNTNYQYDTLKINSQELFTEVKNMVLYIKYSSTMLPKDFGFKLKFDGIDKNNVDLTYIFDNDQYSAKMFDFMLEFKSDFKSTTFENFNLLIRNEINDDEPVYVGIKVNSNVILRNCNIEINLPDSFDEKVIDLSENTLIENCTFTYDVPLIFYFDDSHTDYWEEDGLVFTSTGQGNTTINNNVFIINSFEKSHDFEAVEYAFGIVVSGENFIFTNNEVNVRYVRPILITSSNAIIENNTIASMDTDYTINITGDNNIVRYNTLTSKSGEGDSTVVVTGENNVVEQNPYVEEPSVIDYYVSDADGSDDNDGSIGSPFKTIKTAIDKTDDFNTFNIHILEGIYKGVGNTNLTVPGTNNINFIGAGINKTFIDGEANFTIGGTGSVWGGSGFWNTWYNTSGNWVMNISAGEGIINIHDLTIQNSWASSGSSITATSPTIDNHATLNVSNVYFYSNHAGNGAGIRNNYDGTLYVDNCIFENNTKSSTTGNFGAAVYNNGTAIITNSQIVRNFARWGSVTNDKEIVLVNCTFEGNGAYDGGSGYKNGPSFAADTGIADYYRMYAVYNLSSILINCTFIDNDQCDISNGRGDLYVKGCVFNHSTGVYLFPNTNKANTYIPTQIITDNTFIDMQPSTVFATTISSTTPSVGIRALSSYYLTIANNDINVAQTDYSYGLYLTANATAVNNTLNEYIYLCGANDTITNNTVNTKKENTISLTSAAVNATITDNTLYGGYSAGDLSIANVLATTVLENNKPETLTYEINDENYATYFDENSVLKTDIIANGSKITFINDLTNKKFIFDNVKVFVDVKTTLVNTTIVTRNNAQVLFNNLKISNAKTDEDYVILFDSENNIIKNGNINVTTDKPVQVVRIEGNGNVITGTTINATIPAADMVQSIGNVPTVAVFIRSSNNKLNSSKIYVYSTTAVQGASYPGVEGVDIQSKQIGEYVTGNEIRSTRINVTGGSNVYGLNIIRAKDTITPLSYFDVSSTNLAVAIQIGSSSDNNISGYIYSKSDATAYGYYSTGISAEKTYNTNVSKLYLQEVRAPNAVGIEIDGASNVELSSATYTIYGKNVKAINVVPDYMDNNPENINIYSLTINLNGEKNTSSIISTRNASNVSITNNNMKSTSGNGIILDNTTSSSVTNNYINVANVIGGDYAVTSDVENTIFNNTPTIAVLTDETYSDYFDENNKLKVNAGVISLGGDLHDKVLIIDNHTQVINITNLADYTMYDTTIIIAGNGTYSDRFGFTLDSINFNNTNKPVFIDRFNGTGQKNVKFTNCNIYVTGEDIVAFDALNNESYIYMDISKSNIEMEGTNVIAINYAGYNRGQPGYVSNNNIKITATNNATVFNAEFATIQFNNNVVEVNAPNAVVAKLYNTTISSYNFKANKIQVNATDATVLNMYKGDTTSSYITENKISVTAQNPSTLINITGSKTVYVQTNEIILNANNGETPVVNVSVPSSYVRNNFIMSNDLYGVEAVVAPTVSNITPTRTTITIDAPENVKTLDEVTITANVANATETEGNIVLKINDEIVATSTGNTITHTIVPTTNGTLNIVVEYTNTTTKFVSSSNNGSITVDKISTSISLESNRPFLNENLTITGTLSNEKDTVMADAEITITVNGNAHTVSTDSQGNYNLITSPQEGNNTIVVNYAVTDAYYPSEASTTVFVVDLEKYESFDELNNTINEQLETIESMNNTINELNSTVNEQANIINEMNATVNEQATVIENLTSQFEAQENEIKELNNTLNRLSDIIAQLLSVKDTTITVNSVADLTFNTGLTITGKLADIDGNALTNSYVKVTVNGVDTIVQTDSKGAYKYTTTAKTIGDNEVTVTYEGTDKYNPSTATTTFTVNKADCIITIDSVTSVKYGENVTIVGTFTSTTGKAIANSKVRIDINGKATYVKTDKNGVFVLTTTATKAGENILKASYGGSAYYNSYKTNITFNAEKQDIIITADETSYNDGTFTIKGTFKNAVGQAVKNTNVRVSINGKTYYAKTDANGTFTFTQDITGNKVTYTLGYGGSATYNAYTGTKTTLTFA